MAGDHLVARPRPPAGKADVPRWRLVHAGLVLAPYRRLADVPGVLSLLLWSLLGRLYQPGVPIALTFLVADWAGSYLVAGLVTGALTAGQVVAGPLRGRAADHGSVPRLLLVTGLVYAGGLAALSWWPADWWYAAPLVAFVTGCFMPPVTQVSRAVWASIPERTAREAAYAVEATLQELLFVVAPVLAAMVVAVVSPMAAVLLCAALALVGVAGFAFAASRTELLSARASLTHRSARASGSVFRVPRLRGSLVMGFAFVASVIAIDLLIVAWARDRGTPALAGLLAAAWGAGSLVGGFVAGGLRGEPRLWLRIGAVLGGLAAISLVLPPVHPDPSPWLLAGVLVVSGLAIAPALAAMNGLVGRIAPAGRQAEVFGWFAAATTAGGALASVVTGWLLDAANPSVTAAVAASWCLVAVLLARHLTRPSREAGPDMAQYERT
ncbi:putative arabinose efflux permease, MFS family [Actinoalloteichus cyanogriseus DSM 43889]|uniref:Arabinose efflux permease, MFS family n=1 Tax=Actinoalloteichus caeruleus DSM 43889 TaxID=1120930 RepID=A0ABT1JMH1_ACTCY|nr:putative arabinose efflux permease, MFS family [Actinoalloteichus caeruleus DSM 43889]